MTRVLPYRSTDNFIAGVVLTFTDVTARRDMEGLQTILLRLSDANWPWPPKRAFTRSGCAATSPTRA